ncbi:hypothetical protein L1987_04476 [Smallanthus sonchifolius]|uniref:Uncharacterized protein n=1 Tax=Smallanthus sonchifolius TaxID=185202 RepID=A0ACB9JSN8_9ASTR|nr:hypothetical protein L1987_04476 [Smallanthus sonchifolius]
MQRSGAAKTYPTFHSSTPSLISGGIFLPPDPCFPSPRRLVAIGDLHGDLLKSKQSLRLASLIDSHDRWCGGSSTLVQIGDVLDRGGQELKILYFLEKLKRQAVKSGGNVITMNGLDEFANWAYWFSVGNSIKSLCDGLEKPKDLYAGIPSSFPRLKQKYVAGFALRPNGPIATRFLSKNLTVVVVGESVFVHGGFCLGMLCMGINQEVRDWISGLTERVTSSLVRVRNSLVWLWIFSNEVCDCTALEHVLSTIPGARRMIMGHNIQEGGINGVCDNRALRIDWACQKGA